MKAGLWVWPSDPRAQRKVLRKVAEDKHLVPAMTAISKSKQGLSNAELDDLIGDNSEWMTLWIIKQLTALGFIEFKVDLFGGPARYQLTELGRNMFSIITGRPIQPPPKPPTPPAAQAPAPSQPQTQPPSQAPSQPQAAAPKAA
jgi:hypothetical protein